MRRRRSWCFRRWRWRNASDLGVSLSCRAPGTSVPWGVGSGTGWGGEVDWWQVGSMVVAMVAVSSATAGLVQPTVRLEFGTLRDEIRQAHEQFLARSPNSAKTWGRGSRLREGQASAGDPVERDAQRFRTTGVVDEIIGYLRQGGALLLRTELAVIQDGEAGERRAAGVRQQGQVRGARGSGSRPDAGASPVPAPGGAAGTTDHLTERIRTNCTPPCEVLDYYGILTTRYKGIAFSSKNPAMVRCLVAYNVY